ncbi:S1C family serine protease [Flavonifractor sp. An9]|uniref:S1C family serine protease n=1 Tax=Flavonifractor sp. An9 TaxID=1965664 RepID=UPI000B396E12|nr:trypsin-like peptidase domain-containing protein [Flavonifractor sp. An9]OUN12687.1 trypsin [Flavonifractor sp. An9]
MHGYYYDQNRVYPPEDQDRRRRPGRRGPGKAVVLFCCALALLLVAAVVLRWVGDTLSPREDLFHSGDKSPENTPYDWGDTWDWEDEETGETTVERAPLGDDVTLTLTPQPQTEAHTLQTIYQENIQSIVSIWGDAGTSYSFGTGVVLSADGYIITNTHVIEGCSSVEVVLQDDSSYEALLVGMDVPTDLAVLKIDAQNLHPAVFGNSDELQVGDTVVAIGNPLGQELRGTMTDGIISAINRDVDVDGYSMVLIQTTAALNSGNSGGALINEYGQVVGITNMKMSAYDDTVEGLGFAIPTTTVKTVVDDLIRQGYVSGEPSIGITCYTVTEEMAEEYDLPLGVYVKSVQQDSDAKKQGVFPGDVIVEANGQSITTIEELLALKEGMEAGDVIHFRLWRSGGYLERDVTLMEQYVP